MSSNDPFETSSVSSAGDVLRYQDKVLQLLQCGLAAVASEDPRSLESEVGETKKRNRRKPKQPRRMDNSGNISSADSMYDKPLVLEEDECMKVVEAVAVKEVADESIDDCEDDEDDDGDNSHLSYDGDNDDAASIEMSVPATIKQDSAVQSGIDQNDDRHVQVDGENQETTMTAEKIPCEVCGRKFAKRYMNVHLRAHSKSRANSSRTRRMRTTPARNWKDSTSSDLENDQRDEFKSTVVAGQKLYSCYVCDRAFPKNLMASHLHTHADTKKYQCYVCDRSFTKTDMSEHMKTHNVTTNTNFKEENGVDTVDWQNEQYVGDNNVDGTSEDDEDDDDDGDDDDDDGSDIKNETRSKKSSKRKVKKLPCDYCGKLYRRDYLPGHKRIHTREKQFHCSLCKIQFVSLRELKAHNQNAHSDRAIECDVCNKMFASKASLRQHKRTHSDEKLFQCDVCGKSFKQSSQYCNHLKTHNEGMPYQCEGCGNRYKSVTGLLRHHERHHQGIRHSYTCELCNKSFTRRGKLKDHLMWHKGTSPYICQYCGKRLLSRKTLRTHELIHQDKKPYVCSVCNRGFRQNCVLKRHMSVHTGVKPFCCEFCGKQFIHRVYLAKHTCEMQDMNRTLLSL